MELDTATGTGSMRGMDLPIEGELKKVACMR